MSEPARPNVQDLFLNAARKSAVPVSIHITNGYMIKGAVVKSFDNYAVLIETDGRQMLVYKHAISSVTPEKTLDIGEN